MRKYLPPFLAFSCVMLATLVFLFITDKNHQQNLEEEFELSVNQIQLTLQRSIRDKYLILESTRSLYSVFNDIPHDEFRAYVLPLERELQGVQALQWVAPVKQEQRHAFEQQMLAEGFDYFEITEQNEAGQMIRAAQREIYFPIFPLHPADSSEPSSGFDLASNPVRLEALQRAIDSGEIAATAPLKLIQSQDPATSGILLFAPVYARESTSVSAAKRRQNLIGLVIGVFNMHDIVNEALSSLSTESINLRLRDQEADDAKELYSNFVTSLEPDAGFTQNRTFLMGGRTWLLEAHATPEYLKNREHYYNWIIFISGLLLASLLAAYLFCSALQEQRRKQSEIEKRTLQTQLLRSQKMEALGQLTGGIAHDFNNILSTILGYSSLLLEEERIQSDPATADYLDKIVSSGERARNLIGKMLTFSRNAPTQESPQYLSPLVENSIQLLRPVIPAYINVDFQAQSNLPKAVVDANNFEQVIINLCINARDAIPQEGFIKLRLTLSKDINQVCASCHQNIQGDYVTLDVEDNGEGIPQHAQALIFDPFFTTKEADKGTGMGLSIIHGIVHSANGHIMISSEPGAGTTFKILIPVYQETQAS